MASADTPRTFAGRALTAVALSAAVAVLLLLAWQAADVLLTAFAGVLLGILLRGVASWVASRTGWPQRWALTAVCVLAVAALSGLLTFTATSISQQFSEMFDQLPQAIEQARERIASNPLGRRLLTPLTPAAGEATGPSVSVSQVYGVASQTVGIVGTGVLIAFLGLFLAADPGVYRRGLAWLVPAAARQRLDAVLDEAGEVLLSWLGGRLLLMGVIGVLTWIGLLLLGVPLALALAILASLLSFIPNLGPVISAIPAMLLAATVDPMRGLWVAGLYLAIQTAESYVLEPIVVRRTVSLPPASVITFQLLMGTWLGLLGLALATPLLAVIVVLVTRLYVEDVLGDDADAPLSTRSPSA